MILVATSETADWLEFLPEKREPEKKKKKKRQLKEPSWDWSKPQRLAKKPHPYRETRFYWNREWYNLCAMMWQKHSETNQQRLTAGCVIPVQADQQEASKAKT